MCSFLDEKESPSLDLQHREMRCCMYMSFVVYISHVSDWDLPSLNSLVHGCLVKTGEAHWEGLCPLQLIYVHG